MKLYCFVASAGVVFLAAQLAFASGIPVGVGGGPEEVFFGSLGGGVSVGDVDNPVPIYLDPGAGDWAKTLVIDGGGAGLNPGDKVDVWEHIQVIPPPPQEPPIPDLPLTDWHEEIITPDWRWVSGDLTIHNIPLVVPGVVGGTGANTIWFDWGVPLFPSPDPLDIWIHKELEYQGVPIDPNPEGGTEFVVDILEHPTTVPEPATLGLAALGLAGLLAIAWRRSRF